MEIALDDAVHGVIKNTVLVLAYRNEEVCSLYPQLRRSLGGIALGRLLEQDELENFATANYRRPSDRPPISRQNALRQSRAMAKANNHQKCRSEGKPHINLAVGVCPNQSNITSDFP